ncbi:hypothetical protein A3B51_03485 [Candidatus Curtissbacteria bacterium RIFCSPLOWO2_01_FULL_41_18]|uniref:PIN domain-containing protein n=2 Tax=Candidatus Curtissiibacteriota TaxID=1752717 RepID=A0A1F5FXS9_9BACT|nr:MAG: hypothetical protein A2696_01570 [Candidatus Curtissbacteria bacterium RIFCSPHIGHO2_01_FULL_41_13]OGE04829.1 MAG: hypothetical protein A3B51_03485 [Candidatus Curtissbacteria bacterium RIFCSPLOWO2_01_FULL_41_18]
MAKILLDTSVIIDFLRRKNKDKSTLFMLANGKNELFCSIITHTELYAGKSVWQSTKAKQEIEILFSGIKILALDEAISKLSGQLRSTYDMNLLDAIIAATAVNYSLELATLDLKDFKAIKGLKLVEDI